MKYTRLIAGMLASLLIWTLFQHQAFGAVCDDSACVQAGGKLASLDTSRSKLLDAVVGQLLGTSVSLSAVEWQALSNANVNLLAMLQALQTRTNLGTPQAALNTTVTLSQILNAASDAAQLGGNTVAANALVSLAAQSAPAAFALSDLIKLCVQCSSFADINLNALNLVGGSASLINSRSLIVTPTPVTLSGTDLGLGSTLTSVKLYAKVEEPPAIQCGLAGTTFTGSAIRIKLDMTLVGVDLSSTLNAVGLTLPLGATNVQITLGQLAVFTRIASADGFIDTINAATQAVRVQAKPGIADIYVGAISDTNFFTTTHVINPALDLDYGVIGSLKVNLTIAFVTTAITANIRARAYALGQAPINQTLNFSPPYPMTKTASSSALAINNLAGTLLNSLDIDAQIAVPAVPTAGQQTLFATLMLLLKPVLILIYKVALNGPLTLALGSVVDPALGTLGIRIGEVDVMMMAPRRRCTYTVAGSVYRDSNRSGSMDTGEPGTGLTLYAKLISSTAPAGPALQAVVVNSTTGAFSFSGVDAGTYRIVIDDNATLSDVTPLVLPSGWAALEQNTRARDSVVVNLSDLAGQNFGLIAGTTLTGIVFMDTGFGAGIANDGVRNGNEVGQSGIAVKLTLAADGTTVDSVLTSGDGTYQLFIPSSVANGTALRISETNAPDRVSTGASAGNSVGTYNRTTDTLSFTLVTGTAYTNINFGDVPMPRLLMEGQQTVAPGATAFYRHTFVPGTAGSLIVNVTRSATPVVAGWSETVYVDANNNGLIDATELPVSGALGVAASDTLNLIVKVQAPASASPGSQSLATLAATFSGANAVPALVINLSVKDLTQVSDQAEAGLVLTKAVNKATAKPGEVLQYTITYRNNAAEPLSNVVILDAVPAFTVFASAATGTLPQNLTQVVIAAPPPGDTGGIKWTFTGTLGSGASGTVTFSVTVNP